LKSRDNDLDDSVDYLARVIPDDVALQDYAAATAPMLFGSAAPATRVSATTSVIPTATPAGSVAADIAAHASAGILSYAGALAVLTDAAASTMTPALFSQLTAAVEDLNVAGGVATSAYVQQMLDNVVLGNSANSQWNGGADTATALGDLSAASTATQFNELIGKWFLGTDLPGVAPSPGQSEDDATSYQTYNLKLFRPVGPKYVDVNQGQLGDCWFLSALGETAKQDPSLIEHLITANGNGTYSVEFQVDGQPDYVTVNSQFSTYSGNIQQWDGSRMEFASSTACLWVPLFEKALSELAEQGVATGLQYPAGADQYYELNSGGGEGMTLLTGQESNAYELAGNSGASLKALLRQMHNDIAAGYDVLLGTSDQPVAGNLVADHMFAVRTVNAGTGMVALYNPWGVAGAAGDGKAANFSIAASALVSDHACFFATSGVSTVT